MEYYTLGDLTIAVCACGTIMASPHAKLLEFVIELHQKSPTHKFTYAT